MDPSSVGRHGRPRGSYGQQTPSFGRFSIPSNQALIDGLSIKLVYGDMVEGYLLSQPKEEPEAAPVKAAKGSPKAANAIKPLKNDNKDATAEAAPETPPAQAQGNGTPEFAAAADKLSDDPFQCVIRHGHFSASAGVKHDNDGTRASNYLTFFANCAFEERQG